MLLRRSLIFVSTIFASGLAEARSSQWLYTVPVPEDRPDLREAAKSQVKDVKFELKKDGSAELRYTIPKILTGGEEKKMHLIQPEVRDTRRIVLDSDVAFGVCHRESDSPATYDCRLDYTRDRLNLNPSKIMDHLEQKSSAEELAARQEVGRIFIDEARGILHGIPLRERGKSRSRFKSE